MDAISVLKQDHQTVEELFKKYESTGRRAAKARRKVVDRIVRELSVHAVIEEQVFYPALREAAGESEDMVLESLEEHHIVKWTLSELDGMDPQDERFDAKVRVLMESVRHHVKDEERDLFKRVRAAFKRPELEELGARLMQAKKAAPTRPHPRAPDTPPGNLVAGPTAAIMDAGRDLASGLANAVVGQEAETPRNGGAKGRRGRRS